MGWGTRYGNDIIMYTITNLDTYAAPKFYIYKDGVCLQTIYTGNYEFENGDDTFNISITPVNLKL